MRQFKEKECRSCGTVFQPNAPCNLYCSDECAKKEAQIKQRAKSFAHWKKKAEAEGRGHVVGVGRGNTTKKFKEDSQYKTGIAEFGRLRKIVKQRRYCERCDKDLQDASNFHWCAHHRDHDRTNNVIENIELLCKRCHQIEHECWKAFEGATTIPKGSKDKCPEAPSPSQEGDDIV